MPISKSVLGALLRHFGRWVCGRQRTYIIYIYIYILVHTHPCIYIYILCVKEESLVFLFFFALSLLEWLAERLDNPSDHIEL